jgi:3-hydroxybutyryl-CoA dehydrogenase
MVEVVRAAQTSDETFERAKIFGERPGKTVVVSSDSPGHLLNRVLIPMINEACFELMEGVGTAEDIDMAVRLTTGQLMGPLALADSLGLDNCLATAQMLHERLGDDKYRPCPLLRRYVDAGWLGRKSGRGFFVY